MKLVFALFLLVVSSQSVAADTVRVVKVKGLVFYDGEYLKAGQKIQTGKMLDASGKGWAILAYPGNRKIQFKNARAVLGDLKSKESQIHLKAGQLFGWFDKKRKRDKNAKPFLIKARGVTAGVRGTKFMLEEHPEKTYLCVCEGEISVNKEGKEVALKKGFDLWDKKGATELKEPVYAREQMLDMVAKSVSEMGGTTEAYWKKEGWSKEAK